jgi:hypothetical protein
MPFAIAEFLQSLAEDVNERLRGLGRLQNA